VEEGRREVRSELDQTLSFLSEGTKEVLYSEDYP